MEQFLREHSNILIVSCAASFIVLVTFAFGAVGHIGRDAFKQGAHPQAPEAFTAFAAQFGSISIVGLIVVATVVLSLSGHLDEGSIGILSGVAGYVLGGANKERKAKRRVGRDPLDEEGNAVDPRRAKPQN